VAFVILFLLAAAMAAVFWVQKDTLRDDKMQSEVMLNRLASPQERSSPSAPLRELFSRYDNPPRGQPKQSVIGQMAGQIDELSQLVTGDKASGFAGAKAKAAEAADLIQTTTDHGLAVDIKELKERLDAKDNEAKSLAARMAQIEQELQRKEQAQKELNASYEAKMQQLANEKNAMEQQLKDSLQRYLADQQEAKQKLEQVRDDLNKEIATRNQELNESEEKLREKDEMIGRLQRQLGQKTGSEIVAHKPDGKVMRVLDRAGICYVNIGSKDRVTPGLTFSVYPSSGMPESGEGKARIVVTTVQESVSECRIVQQKAQDPIIVGDLIANVAFDAQRRYTFVVEGQFDLRGAGRPSPEDAKEVRLLINRFGGEVVDQIGVQTDFVVLGEEPARPPRPSDSAQETVWAVYHSKMEEFTRYREVKEAAMNMHIPILNTNRFLAFIGYSPAGTPSQ
jgi:hypothetical protein